MSAAFGASFLWLVILIYFTEGFRSFVWTAVSYQMKDILKLSPSASQFLVSVAYFPWSIKPFYGILSDCIPIRKKKRKPYLVIATILTLFPWLVLGLTSIRSSRNVLTALLAVQNLGAAMADVVIDAMIAEAVRSENAEFSGDLQSLSWSAIAFGGVCGSLLGGHTMSTFKTETTFLIFSVLPIIQLVSCTSVRVVPSESPKMLKQKKQTDIQNEFDRSTTNFSSDNLISQTKRRRKSSNKKDKKKVGSVKSEITAKHHSPESAKWHESFKSAILSLCRALKQPIILRPMAWFFFSHISVPNLSTVMFYYQTEELHLEAPFLGYCPCDKVVWPNAWYIYLQLLLETRETKKNSYVTKLRKRTSLRKKPISRTSSRIDLSVPFSFQHYSDIWLQTLGPTVLALRMVRTIPWLLWHRRSQL